MRTADEIRAEIERITESLKETSPKSYGWRAEMIDRRAALTWVLSDPVPIHADPPTTQKPRYSDIVRAKLEGMQEARQACSLWKSARYRIDRLIDEFIESNRDPPTRTDEGEAG